MPKRIIHTEAIQDALMTQSGMSPDRARRLAAFLGATLSEAAANALWSVTRLKRNPGEMLAKAVGHEPQMLADTRRKHAARVVAISSDDLLSLVDAALHAGPGFATGRELHDRLARSGPPLDITMRGIPEISVPAESIEESLSARPDTA